MRLPWKRSVEMLIMAFMQEMISDTYDPNDLGYLESNNEFENGAYFSYDIYDPFWVILDMHNEVSLEYNQLYAPREFTGLDIYYENRTQFKNKLTVGLEASFQPAGEQGLF